MNQNILAYKVCHSQKQFYFSHKMKQKLKLQDLSQSSFFVICIQILVLLLRAMS